MSLIELFKEHAHKHWERNQMAELLAGYYSGAHGVHIYHQLKHCVQHDDEALYMWGKAVEHLWKNEKEDFDKASKRAGELTEPLMEECTHVNKFNVMAAEDAEWWTTFWTQENAEDKMWENIDRHPLKVKWNALGARVYWATGIYYMMGYSYGRFWTRLMGHPEWNADLSKIELYKPEPEVENALV